MRSTGSPIEVVATRPHRLRRVLAAWLVILVPAVAACVAEPAAPPYRLTARLVDGGVRLDWQDLGHGPDARFRVQVSSAATGWVDRPLVQGTTTVVTGLTNRVSYSFRVRLENEGEATGPWSDLARLGYFDPVLPVLRIDIEGGASVVDKDDYLDATLEVDPNGTGVPAYSGALEIRGRGNSTWTMPKKPYRLKLASKTGLLGMPSNRHWVLLANYLDPSQLRTWAAGELGRDTDLDWTPRSRHVEVVVNGRYDGVYQLVEHVRIDGDRVDITELDPDDVSGEAVTGGYLLEVDPRLELDGEQGFRTARWLPLVIDEPEDAPQAQLDYIRQYVQSFEDALFSPQFADPALGYRQFLDVASFIDHYLVQETSRNQDAFRASTYFSKDRGGKLVTGPLWDFDVSMGSPAAATPNTPEGWRARGGVLWPDRIFQDPAFVDEVIARWDELRPAFELLPDRIEELGASLQPAVANDLVRWGRASEPAQQPQFVADWLRARIAWMDAQFHPGGT